MARLTKRQAEILEFIENQMDIHGEAPTVREIAEEFGIRSTNAIADHLKALERKGVIERDPRSARGIHLPAEEVPARQVPLLGNIAAGLPILAEENREGYVTVGEEFDGKGELFALRVNGDSMIDAHIMPDDVVIIRMQQTADRGQIVAALLNDEATLKTYMPQGSKVLLLPANESYDPIVIERDSESHMQILGIAVGLIRRNMTQPAFG